MDRGSGEAGDKTSEEQKIYSGVITIGPVPQNSIHGTEVGITGSCLPELS